MKVSLNWIRDYVDLPADLTPEQLAYDLTMRTVEVEGWWNPASRLDKIVVGEILSVEAHPQADRLRVCQVAIGADRPYQIVCGGSNLTVGQKVVVSPPGSFVVWHGEGEAVEIKAGKLRGVLSEGMICGANEVGLELLFPATDEHEIVDLSALEGAEAGRPLADLLDLADCILEIDNKSMTNRPDLWGHYGLARELAAIYKLPLRALPTAEARVAALPTAFPVQVEAPEACPRYTATLIEGVSNGPAPFWMRRRLAAIGQRPISLLVDLTNYCMFATGEPCHGFDAACVQGGLRVRQARAGERLLLLDESEVELEASDLLIADEEKALALAGIMGGKHDSLWPDTSRMILEVASFKARGIRRTATRLAVRSEAEARFEKALDVARVDQTLGLFLQLCSELLPEARLTAFSDVCTAEAEPCRVKLSLDYLAARLGRKPSHSELQETLGVLGFGLKLEGEMLTVEVPSWRATGDVSMPADIVEEVARMIGYENFDFKAPQISLEAAVQTPAFDLERRLKEYLAARCDFQEIFTYPWIEQDLAELAGQKSEESLRLATPPAPELANLRATVLPGLFHALRLNERYFDAFSVFELTQIFKLGVSCPNVPEEKLPLFERHLGLASYGKEPWTLFRAMKGVLEAIPRACQTRGLVFQAAAEKPGWADPALYLEILTEDGRKLGSFGLLSRRALQALDLKRGYAAVTELNVEELEALPSRDNSFSHLPQFPLVEQDLSLLVPDELSWAEIQALIEPSVARLDFIDEYRGAQIPAGQKSLTLRVWLQKADGTFTSEEIEERMRGLTKRLQKQLGAVLRS